ncbi:hypothetical protein HG536_0C06510 [Torulaspora globosa]|uniref:5-formyltetrahydrofolate cyclo-ligase n=1 Tax=Torulaspora globosa TaxID=48254 RepID=A0A7G3ZG46_9SACH|nr:uncharacterized protein HG536_0C06510 [Torulaspora globosa]QLL32482.1 hypothetical protein HG536_0C06510 [Torulaspora globosa]
MSAKQLLRKAVKELLATVPQVEIERQSQAIAEALVPILAESRNVACFMSMDKGEVDTQFVLEHLFREGKTVYLPRCTSTRETGHVSLRASKRHHPHLTFHRMQSMKQVRELKPQGSYQLREPAREDPAPLPARLDVMLVPGVAFRLSDGGRIGHGAGFYDDYFQRYQLQHHGDRPLLIGLSLKEQIVDEIPLESHDWRMDCVVTGDGQVHWSKK